MRADPEPVWGVFPMRTVPGVLQPGAMTHSPDSPGSTVRTSTVDAVRRSFDDDMARALIRARVRRQRRRVRVLTRV